MLKHILVPLDQSALAESALEHLEPLVDAQSQITLLSIIVPMDLSINSLYPGSDEQVESEISGQYEGLARQMRVQAESYLRQVAERLHRTGARIDILVQVGKAAEVIVENAADLNVDAIVMATHGRSGISRWLLGSVTQKVLSAAPCPVYVIPSRKH